MTAVAMNNLWTYIQGLNLSARNQKWLSDKLMVASQQPRTRAKENLTPYTMEEINAMIDEAERQSAAGIYVEHETLFRELLEEDVLQEAV